MNRGRVNELSIKSGKHMIVNVYLVHCVLVKDSYDQIGAGSSFKQV